jgi:hypothetical protein
VRLGGGGQIQNPSLSVVVGGGGARGRRRSLRGSGGHRVARGIMAERPLRGLQWCRLQAIMVGVAAQELRWPQLWGSGAQCRAGGGPVASCFGHDRWRFMGLWMVADGKSGRGVAASKTLIETTRVGKGEKR